MTERYEIYEVVPGRKRGTTRKHVLMASCGNKEAVGVTLVTLAEDRWEAGVRGVPQIAILDTSTGRWVTGPAGRF